MQVKEVMSRRIIAISPEETVAVAARLLSQHNIGAAAGTGGCAAW